MGMSRPSSLNTMISPTRIGESDIYKKSKSPLWKAGSMLPLLIVKSRSVYVFFCLGGGGIFFPSVWRVCLFVCLERERERERGLIYLPEHHNNWAFASSHNHKRLPNHQCRRDYEAKWDNLQQNLSRPHALEVVPHLAQHFFGILFLLWRLVVSDKWMLNQWVRYEMPASPQRKKEIQIKAPPCLRNSKNAIFHNLKNYFSIFKN